MDKLIKILFHKAGREGRAITLLRQIHAKRGLHLSPYRAELILRLARLKKQWLKNKLFLLKLNTSATFGAFLLIAVIDNHILNGTESPFFIFNSIQQYVIITNYELNKQKRSQ